MSMVTDIAADSKLRKMSAASGGRDTAAGITDLLNWNNLTYKMPVTNSVISARNLKRYPADRQQYSWGPTGTGAAGPIFFHIQSGEQYVDWAKSFLEFEIEADVLVTDEKGDGQDLSLMNQQIMLTFGTGSALNFIDEVIVSTRSGTEIHRIEQFARWRAMTDRLTRSAHWFATVGKAMGYSADMDFWKAQQDDPVLPSMTNTVANAVYAIGDITPFADDTKINGVQLLDGKYSTAGTTTTMKRKFVVPLSQLGGPFATGQLSPAVLSGGLVIELRLGKFLEQFQGVKASQGPDASDRWGDVENAFLAVAGNGCLMKDIFIHLDTHLLNDSSMRALAQTATKGGLDIVYEGVFHQQVSSTSTQLNATCTKAVSRALRVMGGYYSPNTANLSNDPVAMTPAYSGDPGAGTSALGQGPGTGLKSFQWRLGSQYYPHVQLDSLETMYANLLYSLEYIDDESKETTLRLSGFRNYYPVHAATFERSSLLKYSGSAINNSRTLSLKSTRDTSDALEFHFWMEYLTVAKVFLNNCIVSI